jgi:hypothetical protein
MATGYDTDQAFLGSDRATDAVSDQPSPPRR